MTQHRRYRGNIVTLRDASLFDIEYDLGFGVFVRRQSRLIHPHTGEALYTRNKQYGSHAREYVRKWLYLNPVATVDVVSYDGPAVLVYIVDGDTTLNQRLVDDGYAIEETSKRDVRVASHDEPVEPAPLLMYEGENAYRDEYTTHDRYGKTWLF